MVEGNPVYLAIIERDPSLINTIKEHVQKVLTEKFGDKAGQESFAGMGGGRK